MPALTDSLGAHQAQCTLLEARAADAIDPVTDEEAAAVAAAAKESAEAEVAAAVAAKEGKAAAASAVAKEAADAEEAAGVDVRERKRRRVEGNRLRSQARRPYRSLLATCDSLDQPNKQEPVRLVVSLI